LRDQLKAGLSGTAHEPGKEKWPSVSELAERIKSLKAEHSIEAAPQRVLQKHSSAEEPVTARIRRRTEALPASDQAIQPYAVSSAAETLSPESGQNSSGKPPMPFQERIAR
jgi:hypothetical protein